MNTVSGRAIGSQSGQDIHRPQPLSTHEAVGALGASTERLGVVVNQIAERLENAGILRPASPAVTRGTEVNPPRGNCPHANHLFHEVTRVDDLQDVLQGLLSRLEI